MYDIMYIRYSSNAGKSKSQKLGDFFVFVILYFTVPQDTLSIPTYELYSFFCTGILHLMQLSIICIASHLIKELLLMAIIIKTNTKCMLAISSLAYVQNTICVDYEPNFFQQTSCKGQTTSQPVLSQQTCFPIFSLEIFCVSPTHTKYWPIHKVAGIQAKQMLMLWTAVRSQ